MTRSAMPQPSMPPLDHFDPEVIEAARDVAARAGVPLETWIASVVPQPGDRAGRRHRRHRPDPLPNTAAEQAQRPLSDAPQAAQAPGLATLMGRLDGLDRALEADRRSAREAETRRLEALEARIERALKGGAGDQVGERLGEIERRMSQLGEQMAAGRAPGRRGRAAADLRDAVQEIRQRQRELSGEPATRGTDDGGIVASMRRDLARRLEAEEAVGPSVVELQHETGRLREAIDRLAEGRDVGALEQAVVSLATGVERAQSATDLTAVAAPIEAIRAQVERLAEEVADNVHARVVDDVQRLAGRLDAAALGTSAPDRPALEGLFGELDEIRRMVAALAGPERIQGLAQGLQAVSAQIAQLQSAAGAEASLRPLLEEIRSDVRGAGPAALATQIEALAAKVDALQAHAERSVSARPDGDVAREGAGSPEMASIQLMLGNLAEKVDRVGSRAGGEGLDALEQQVLTLADRLDAPRGADPALAGLEHTMGELLRQVAALRDTAPSEAQVERAAREAVARSIGGQPAGDPGEIGLLRASLADMQVRQAASDQRLGATLEGVQSALDRLVARLGPAEPAAPSLESRLLGSASHEAARVKRPTERRAEREPVLGSARPSDGLLEPGAARPVRDAYPARELQADPDGRETAARRGREGVPTAERLEAGQSGDIKTSFIAAARRAAQAAQAELVEETSEKGRGPAHDGARISRASIAAARGDGPLARLRAEIDRRRRPLLLGLAAIVLALGALQAASMRQGEQPAPAAARTAAATPAETRDAAKDAPKEQARDGQKEASKEAAKPADAKPTDAKPADPVTTQALPTPPAGEARPAPAKASVPRVAGMDALSGDLANLPTGLAKLRQSALDGDGAAIWELAAREADGRGMPRDLSVAAKLYERLAGVGYAPAQYKTAGHYEKGAGVVRDLAQAKLWYGRAAEQGHARSMHNLAVIYAENPAANGKPDFASAASWFRQGAEYGIRDSQYNLAVLYARGLGLTQDLVQSYAWFSAAAAQGDDDAGKKRDDVANKLSPADLASAKGLAAAFKPRKLDAAANEPPAPREPVAAPMSLLGAPSPSAAAYARPGHKAI